MLSNYFLSAFRNFWRFRGYTLLNLLGLAIGTTASLLIGQYVLHELSFDQFHQDKDRIYRVQYDFLRNGELMFQCASAFPAVGPAMQADFPEVEAYARMYMFYGGAVVRQGEQAYKEQGIYVVDPTFLTMFDYPWVAGDRDHALDEPNTVVITQQMAQKYFGDQDPLGQEISLATFDPFKITGVIKSPDNSHLTFNFLVSIPSIYVWGDDMRETLVSNWGWYDFFNYVRLAPGTDVASLEAKLPGMIAQRNDQNKVERTRLTLQPLTDIHLYSDLIQEHRPNGDGTITYVLLGLALFILLIAWINYVNLSTARSLSRAREVGVRKAVGARRIQLISQFLLETLLLNLLAIGLAVVLYELSRSYFQQLLGHELAVSLFVQPVFWWAVLGFATLGTALAGLYPAFVLSAYRPASVLKGRLARSQGGAWLRKGLVVGQFVASVAMIAGTVIVYQQLRYMRSQDLGMNIEQTLVLNGPEIFTDDSTYLSAYRAFQQDLLRVPGVQQVAASSEIPGSLIYWTNGGRGVRQPRESNSILYLMGVNEDFLPTYDIKLLAGRNYGTDYGLDGSSIILNETACQAFGLGSAEAAIGQQVIKGGDTLRVVGVIVDYHQQSLKKAHIPIALVHQPETRSYYSVKLASKDVSETLAQVEAAYQAQFPGNPVVYRFLDDFFDQQYRAEQRFGMVFTLFAGLAIAVACLGLIGLSMFTAAQRRKEVSIRKVLGSSVQSIFLLLSREFFFLILLANVMAVLLVWWPMEQWLAGFAFRIELQWWMFALAAGITMLIAMATVSWQALRAAHTNPAEVLRSE
jgi:putative ABC transport system permease protein